MGVDSSAASNRNTLPIHVTLKIDALVKLTVVSNPDLFWAGNPNREWNRTAAKMLSPADIFTVVRKCLSVIPLKKECKGQTVKKQ